MYSLRKRRVSKRRTGWRRSALDRDADVGEAYGCGGGCGKVLQSARGEWVPTAEISGPALPRQKERRGW